MEQHRAEHSVVGLHLTCGSVLRARAEQRGLRRHLAAIAHLSRAAAKIVQRRRFRARWRSLGLGLGRTTPCPRLGDGPGNRHL